MPFIGRSRFDPHSLHGPWHDPSASPEDIEAAAAALAALPRSALSSAAAKHVAAQQGIDAAALHPLRNEPRVKQVRVYPKTIFDTAADLEPFDDPYALLSPGRGRTAHAHKRYKRLRVRRRGRGGGGGGGGACSEPGGESGRGGRRAAWCPTAPFAGLH